MGATAPAPAGRWASAPAPLPHSPECERAILGALLLDAALIPEAGGCLQPVDFYSERHRLIYAAILELHNAGRRPDVRTVQALLEDRDQLEGVGGVAYVAGLDTDLPSISGLGSYVDIVRSTAGRRRALQQLPELERALLEGRGWTEAGATLDAALRATHEGGSVLRVLTVEELLTLRLPPRERLNELVTAKDLIMVYSWRGLGKSWFSLSLALAVASGSDFLRWKAERPASVLYVDGELPAEDLRERVASLAAGMETEGSEPLRFLAADVQDRGLPSLLTTEGQRLVESHLDGARLVVFDNLATLFGGGSENDAEVWQPAQDLLLSLRRKGCAVVLVHHSGKGGQQRGTSSREDTLDKVLTLKRPSDYQPSEGCRFEIHFEKARGLRGELIEPLEARLVEDAAGGGLTWGLKDVRGRTRERVLELARLGMSQGEIAGELKVHKSTVCRHLKGEQL